MILVRMSVGDDLTIESMDLSEWERALSEVRRSKSFINIHDPDGRKMGINPVHIVYWELRP